jgi:hypothetical protein
MEEKKLIGLKSLTAKGLNDFMDLRLKWYQLLWLDIVFWFQDRFSKKH